MAYIIEKLSEFSKCHLDALDILVPILDLFVRSTRLAIAVRRGNLCPNKYRSDRGRMQEQGRVQRLRRSGPLRLGSRRPPGSPPALHWV